MAKTRKIFRICLTSLMFCLAICLWAVFGFNAVAVAKAEEAEAPVYDLFDADFAGDILEGQDNWCPDKGTYVIGDYGVSSNVGLKTRVYISSDIFRFAFTLSSDGVTGTERLPDVIGGYYMVIFTPGHVVVTMPGFYDNYISAQAFYDGLAVGSTVSIEMMISPTREEGPPTFTLKMDGQTFIDQPADCGNGIYGGVIGNKVLLNSDGNIVFETSSKTCVHETGEWTEPNANYETFLLCKHCGLALKKDYYADICDIAQITGENSTILENKGVLGELSAGERVGISARIYLPDTGRFALKFSILSDGVTFNDMGSYKGAFELFLKNGNFSVLDSNGTTIETITTNDLSAGKTVSFQFGVYTYNANEHRYFVKINDRLLTNLVHMDNSDSLGLKCAYAVNMPILIESTTATCEHALGESTAVDSDGYQSFCCAICERVIYKDKPQRVFDISEFTNSDATVINGVKTMDVQQVGYTAIRGIIYIPSDAPSNFSIKFLLMGDGLSPTWTQNGEYEGMYLYTLTKNTIKDTMPWAAHMYVDKEVYAPSVKAGNTFSFEIGLYQIDDNFGMRESYLKINGETVISFLTRHDNPFVGTQFMLTTNTDIVFMKHSECTETMHKFGEWGDLNEHFIRSRVCQYCGCIGQQEEILSNVSFKANFEGIITLVDQEIAGEEFVYNVPNVPGYRLKDIKVNGESVFANATELAYGYTVTIPRDSLDIAIEGIYEESSWHIGYQFNKDVSITVVGDTTIGQGNTAVYKILPKNNKDVVKATVNGEEYTDKLTIIQGGYTLSILNVKEDISLVVEMGKVEYSVTVEDTVGGSLSLSQAKVTAFGSVQVTATIDEGYYLLYFLVNGEKVSSKNEVLMLENIKENLVVSAVYTMEMEETPGSQGGNDSSIDSTDDSGCGSVLSMVCAPIMLVICGLALTKGRRQENDE